LLVGACSLVNKFDEVKETAAGGSGGSISGTGGSGDSDASGTGGGSATGGGAGTGGDVSGSGGGTGGSESMDAGGGSVSDAPAEAAPKLLTCRWVNAQPVTIDDYSSLMGELRTLGDRMFAEPLNGSNRVRFIAQHNGPQNAYELYDVDDHGNANHQTISSNGRITDVRRTSSTAISGLVVNTTNARLDLHVMADDSMGQTAVISPLTNPGQLPNSGETEAVLGLNPRVPSELAFATSYVPAQGRVTAGFGVYLQNGPVDITEIATLSASKDALMPRGIVRSSQGTTYAFVGDPTSVIVTKMGGTPSALRAIGEKTIVLDLVMDDREGVDVMAAELGNPPALLVGNVAAGQLDGFTTKDLVPIRQFTGLGDVPIGGPSHFRNGSIVLAGPLGGQGSTKLGFLWLTSSGQIVTNADISGGAIMGGIHSAVAAPRQMFGTLGGEFHVLWTEQYASSNGAYEKLMYDLLTCQ
jgi:hypothetical protein